MRVPCGCGQPWGQQSGGSGLRVTGRPPPASVLPAGSSPSGPRGRSSWPLTAQHPPESVIRDRKDLPPRWSGVSVTEYRHISPTLWTRRLALDRSGTGPHRAGGQGSWEAPRHWLRTRRHSCDHERVSKSHLMKVIHGEAF